MSVVYIKGPGDLTLHEQHMNQRRSHADDCPFLEAQRAKSIEYAAFDAARAKAEQIIVCLICGGGQP